MKPSPLNPSLLPQLKTNARVALLGGAFDPPHVSHQLLALSVLAIEPIDQLWIIPCANHPFQKSLSSFEHRLAMCELAFSRLSKDVFVVPIENHLPHPNYTVRTMEAILSLRPDLKLCLAMGSDVLPQLPQWHRPEALEELSELIIFLRQGFPVDSVPEQIKKPHIHQGYILPDIKSSAIREALKGDRAGFQARHEASIDRRVAAYINQHRLYA